MHPKYTNKTHRIILDIPLGEPKQDEPAESEPLPDDLISGTATVNIHNRNARLRLGVSIYTQPAQKRHCGEKPEELEIGETIPEA